MSISTIPDKMSVRLSNKRERVLVIGASGFIGSCFYGAYQERGIKVTGTRCRSSYDGLIHFDLKSGPDGLPDLDKVTHVVFTGGISGIKVCEDNPEGTKRINVTDTLALADWFRERKIHMTWFSSDGIFDGISGGYSESSPIRPINEYGRQKAETEKKLIKLSGDNTLILRLSKVYGLGVYVGNFIDEMATRLVKNETVYVADDNRFCPTSVYDVVEVALRLQDKNKTGLYNLAAPEKLSWHDVAVKLANCLGVDPGIIKKVSLKSFHGCGLYPLKTDMVCERLYSDFPGYEFTRLDHILPKLWNRS